MDWILFEDCGFLPFQFSVFNQKSNHFLSQIRDTRGIQRILWLSFVSRARDFGRVNQRLLTKSFWRWISGAHKIHQKLQFLQKTCRAIQQQICAAKLFTVIKRLISSCSLSNRNTHPFWTSLRWSKDRRCLQVDGVPYSSHMASVSDLSCQPQSIAGFCHSLERNDVKILPTEILQLLYLYVTSMLRLFCSRELQIPWLTGWQERSKPKPLANNSALHLPIYLYI